jgi:ATP-dependent Lhr-like helicase
LVSGLLVLGPTAQRRFGRKNFMELYAVFSSPQSYSVHTACDQPLGTLGQDFVDGLVEQVSCFLLGGRAWAVAQISHQDRVVKVQPAPRGKQPTRGGFLPQFIGEGLCTKIRDVLVSSEAYGYLNAEACRELEDRRRLIQSIDSGPGPYIDMQDSELHWWTFAGGKINSTLRYALQSLLPEARIIMDNFRLRLHLDGLTDAQFRKLLQELQQPDFWTDAVRWKSVAGLLPAYRLSKFQPLMPDWVQQEFVAEFLLDLPGTQQCLRHGEG